MSDLLASLRGFAWLGMLEAARARLWLLFAAGVGLVVASTPALRTVQPADQLKLAVAVLCGVLGFVAVLTATLLAASALRRDLDSRASLMLFSKPVVRLGYLLGRWVGVQVWLGVGMSVIAVVGALAIWLHQGRLPEQRQVIMPTAWQQLNLDGSAEPVPLTRDRIYTGLSGLIGVEWTLPALGAISDGDQPRLLLRCLVTDPEGLVPRGSARVAMQVRMADGSLRRLHLDTDSPNGFPPSDAPQLPPTEALLDGKDETANDLSSDYARFVLPAELASTGQPVQVQLVVLDRNMNVIVHQQASLLCSLPGGNLFGNLLRAVLVVLAIAGLLGALALAVSTVGGVGVVAITCLTLYFGGLSVGMITEASDSTDHGVAAKRVFSMLAIAFPDLGAYQIEQRLAGSRAVEWATVAAAWAYYGCYTLVFLLLGWLGLARREV